VTKFQFCTRSGTSDPHFFAPIETTRSPQSREKGEQHFIDLQRSIYWTFSKIENIDQSVSCRKTGFTRLIVIFLSQQEKKKAKSKKGFLVESLRVTLQMYIPDLVRNV